MPRWARFTSLQGKTIGILDNSKPNADRLAERLAELLKERYGVANVVSRRKLTAQQGAPKNYVEELAAQADFVLAGQSVPPRPQARTLTFRARQRA